jgi:hypothetical protein
MLGPKIIMPSQVWPGMDVPDLGGGAGKCENEMKEWTKENGYESVNSME